MENYNWIKCIDKNFNKEVEVRQRERGSDVFVDRDGCIHNIADLDFTVKLQEDIVPISEEFIENFKKNLEETNEVNEATLRGHEQFMNMLDSLDAKSIADHQAKIDERAYWRKLRGDIFLAIHKDYNVKMHSSDATKQIFDTLYEQDKEFFDKKFGVSE